MLLFAVQLFTGCQTDIGVDDNSSAWTDSVSSQADALPTDNSPSKTPLDSHETLTVNVLDVGQGDSIFIVLPNGETMLIDAGNQSNAEEICSFIKDCGIESITYLVATHPHSDHIGGMAEVIKSLDIKNVYMPKVSHTTVTFENLLDTIAEKGLIIQTAKAGKILFDNGGLKAEFIAPNKDSYTNLNNYSAVIKLSYNGKTFLFMGDAERESESEILANGFDLSADVIKVGHHGSNTASTKSFIKAVNPSVAVISVGKNSYGHPHAAAITTLNEFNADIWRTDEKGTVIITCDGTGVIVDNTVIVAQPNAPPDTSKEESNPSTEKNNSVTVYITKTGAKYHADGCRYLSQSKIPIDLNDINTSKYSPCSVCNPPAK